MKKRTAAVALPKGYLSHDGGECPVNPEDFVDCIIRTAEGLGHSDVMRARLHEWKASEHPDGIGAVVGFRLARPNERLTPELLHKRWS